MVKLSIITISYNNASGLRETVDSVLFQTAHHEIEYIVVDGGSNDGSRDFLNTCSDKLERWVSEPDKGIYNAMNKGVGMATGEYCLFLNSGDVLHDSSVLERVLPQLDGTDFVIGKVLFLNSGQTSDVAEPLTLNRFYNGSVPHPATFIKREWLSKYPYDESLRIVSDWKFFMQALILDNAPYKLIDDVITDFDCEGISASNKSLVYSEREKVFAELFPPRVMLDYLQFKNGSGYKDTSYDKFFIKLRDFKYANFIYALDVMIMKFIALFRKGAGFAKGFTTKIK